jgi:hypothetical protein
MGVLNRLADLDKQSQSRGRAQVVLVAISGDGNSLDQLEEFVVADPVAGLFGEQGGERKGA